MFRSLRFRLPALFLAGIALTGLVSTLIAFGLFRNYTQSQARKELRREAAGLTQLYAEQARRTQERGTQPPFFAARRLETASGNRLFYVGVPFFSGQTTGCGRLPQSAVDFNGDPARRDARVRVHAARTSTAPSSRSPIRSISTRADRRSAGSSSPRRRPS